MKNIKKHVETLFKTTGSKDKTLRTPHTDHLVYMVTGITIGGLASAGYAYRGCRY